MEERIRGIDEQLTNINRKLATGTDRTTGKRGKEKPLTPKKKRRLLWNKETLEGVRQTPHLSHRKRTSRPQPF